MNHTARDHIEQNRALSPVSIVAGTLNLIGAAGVTAGLIDFESRLLVLAMAAAGIALVAVGMRDWTCKADRVEDEA